MKALTLIVTGSIAAVKSFDLVQLLQSKGIKVSMVLTEAAQQWVTKEAAQTVTGQPVMTSADIGTHPKKLHSLLAGSNAILVAPASADFIKQLACGDSDLAHAVQGSGKPLVIAPAMNVMMWQHPATQRNVTKLLSASVLFLGPVSGRTACGDMGYGRFMEPADIASALPSMLASSQHAVFDAIRHALVAAPSLPALSHARTGSQGKKILLMIQGGKDALVVYPLISALQLRGHQVTCAISAEAAALLPATGLAGLTSRMVYTHHYQDDMQGMEHIRLPEQSDIVLVAPATAAGVREMAEGGSGSFLGCTYLASKKPVILLHSIDPEVQPMPADLEQLRKDGVYLLDIPQHDHPASKERAEAITHALERLIDTTATENKTHARQENTGSWR